jgi:hypothetical protein
LTKGRKVSIANMSSIEANMVITTMEDVEIGAILGIGEH